MQAFAHAFAKEKAENRHRSFTVSPSGALFLPNPNLRLREQLREVMRFHQYALRIEDTYWFRIRRFILFHNKQHPKKMGPAEAHLFLTHLAARENVAASTQNACWPCSRRNLTCRG
ncbi:MAG: hypothetical protein FJ404_13740 [Verrucomicrobia bacterium]|nr:hypothetical protein [Verrucomicrobiota bacterium]